MGNAASADRPFLVFPGSIPGKNIIMFFLDCAASNDVSPSSAL
jgi:hypothetical protein